MSRATEFEMELRCPDCASPEVALIGHGTRLGCGNCGAELAREEAFVSVADAEAYAAESLERSSKQEGTSAALFRFDACRAAGAINDADGAIWPVNSFADADELNSLFEAAVQSGVIRPRDPGALVHVYPHSLSDPAPILAVRLGSRVWLGQPLKLGERDGESPLDFTLRLLEETVGEANDLLEATGERTDRSST